LGFSAGGHLSAALSTTGEDRAYSVVDGADKEVFKPAFTILIYPGGLIDRDHGDKIASGLNITSNTPPTFSVMAEDDPVRPENVLLYTLALKQAKVPAEVHVYPSGGHGYGLRPSKHLVTTWPKRAEEWMRSRGYLERAK
jgi:acetyl esterase/lipase